MSQHGTVSVSFMFTFIVLYFIVFRLFIKAIIMNTYHAASWSDPYSSSDEEEICCYTRSKNEGKYNHFYRQYTDAQAANKISLAVSTGITQVYY